MKRKFIVFVIAASSLLGTGCSAAWFQEFQNNPVEKTQAFVESVHTLLGVADFVWNSVKTFLPGDIAPRAQQKYGQAVFATNKSLVVLQDAVQAAAEVKNAHPNLSKLMQDVSDAVAQVQGIIDEFKDTPAALKASPDAPVKPEQPAGYDDLKAAALTVKRVGGVQ